MGYYINPQEGTKEAWLKSNAREVEEGELKITPEELPVVLVDNRAFTAAGICYDSQELKEFTNPRDQRPKRWFMVTRACLAPFYSEGKK